MSYQITPLLLKAEQSDFAYMIKTIKSYVNFSSDTELRGLFDNWVENPVDAKKALLAEAVEREIRYAGSADVAFVFRKIFGSGEVAGADIHEIIADVSDKLKVKLKRLSSAEAKLEHLVKSLASRQFFSLSAEEQEELLSKCGFEKEERQEFFRRVKENKHLLFPLLLRFLGPEIVTALVEALLIRILAAFIGKEAAKEILMALAKKYPLWAEWLGPIVWTMTIAWVGYDLQGAAYRKTIPCLLRLGIVALRDGPQEGESFWNASVDVTP